MNLQKILIAIDGSEYSLHAADYGLTLARKLKAEAALIFVVDTKKTLGDIDAGVFTEELTEKLTLEAEQTLDLLANQNDDLNLVKFVPKGHPKEEIIKTAEEWETDLIIAGTHGRTGLLHLLLGSVAESIVRMAKIPVLVVPVKK